MSAVSRASLYSDEASWGESVAAASQNSHVSTSFLWQPTNPISEELCMQAVLRSNRTDLAVDSLSTDLGSFSETNINVD